MLSRSYNEKSAFDHNHGLSRNVRSSIQHGAPSHDYRTEPRGDEEGKLRVRRMLQNAAARNSELLAVLMATQEAVSLVQDYERKLSVLEEEIASQSKVIADTTAASKAELERHNRYRSSIAGLKRLYYVLTRMRRKWDGQVVQAEEAYFEALKCQAGAEGRQKQLQRDLAALEWESHKLAVSVHKHAETHRMLDELYEKIFKGPTPGFPEEDDREMRHQRKTEEYKLATERLKAVFFSSKNVATVKRAVERAKTEYEAAALDLECSIFDFSRAVICLARCGRFIEQAVSFTEAAATKLDQIGGHELVDAHRFLLESLQAVQALTAAAKGPDPPRRQALNDIIQAIPDRLALASEAQQGYATSLASIKTAAKEEVKERSRVLEDSRQALQEIRQAAFEVVAGFGAAAPAYHECCDRAGGLEEDAAAQSQAVTVPVLEELPDMPPPPDYDRRPLEVSAPTN